MDTSAAQLNNVNIQSVQVPQPSQQKDVVSDVGSFQDTLNDLNLQNNAGKNPPVNENVSVKTDVEILTDNMVLDKNTQNCVQGVSEDSQSILSNNINNLENIETLDLLGKNFIKQQNLDFIDKKSVLPNEIQPQVNQATQELVVLPQMISDTKKDVKEPVGLIKMGHISKEDAFNPIEDNLKFLDESLKTVSDKNLTQLQNTDIVENILVDKADINSSMVNNIDMSFDNKIALQSISELNSKISAINSINTIPSKMNTVLGSIKMDKEDANFFVNMVENQNNNVFQANITLNNVNNQITFADVKAQATQSSAAVSQALIEKLQESMNTNKAFRVDFDNNVAVIMRVDSNGVLSANFIPGSSAVEQYLRNNIAELRQAFDNKGLEYNELSYSSRKQNQNKQQRNQRGGKDE